MKELSIEEKAKAYDEVLNKLRHFITKGVDPLITRADVQDFFPELAESGDERIRKALIDFFSKGAELNETTNGVADKDIIAWLEKPRPVWSREDQRNLVELKQRMSQIDHYWNRPTDEKLIDWLDSIKERMQKGE